ncbi:MAG TPA: XdhC family protein, partial [Gemmatimonadaceae bacterium]|nr:XdhC family protein [Gemmatimonadaceae bacterium]
MTTHRSIVDALASAADAGDSIVVATVVRVTGSSYGGVGARMVVRVDGSTVGIVSGGCLETDLADHARKVHETGIARVVTYDTRADDDAAWGLGLGCNGLIDVLLEPLNSTQAREVGDLLVHALRSETQSILATVTNVAEDEHGTPEVGAHALLGGSIVETTGDWGNGSALLAAQSMKDEALAAGRRGLLSEFGRVQVAFEVVTPTIRLVICGSGPDAVPLVRFATQLGWDVIVVDHRPVAHAPVERFPGAVVVECADSLKLGQSVDLTTHTAAVVMSHHYARDLEYVRSLLDARVGYVGILGPRARADRMFGEIAALNDASTPPRDTV